MLPSNPYQRPMASYEVKLSPGSQPHRQTSASTSVQSPSVFLPNSSIGNSSRQEQSVPFPMIQQVTQAYCKAPLMTSGQSFNYYEPYATPHASHSRYPPNDNPFVMFNSSTALPQGNGSYQRVNEGEIRSTLVVNSNIPTKMEGNAQQHSDIHQFFSSPYNQQEDRETLHSPRNFNYYFEDFTTPAELLSPQQRKCTTAFTEDASLLAGSFKIRKGRQPGQKEKKPPSSIKTRTTERNKQGKKDKYRKTKKSYQSSPKNQFDHVEEAKDEFQLPNLLLFSEAPVFSNTDFVSHQSSSEHGDERDENSITKLIYPVLSKYLQGCHWFLDILHKLRYPLLNNARCTRVSWSQTAGLQVNGIPVDSRTLYVIFVQEHLGLFEIWHNLLHNFGITRSAIDEVRAMGDRPRFLRRLLPEENRSAFTIDAEGRVTWNENYKPNSANDHDLAASGEIATVEEEVDIILYLLETALSNLANEQNRFPQAAMELNEDLNTALQRLGRKERCQELFQSFMNIIQVLEIPPIERRLTLDLLRDLDRMGNSKRALMARARVGLANMSQEIQNSMVWAIYEEFISEKTIRPFLSHPASFDIWNKIFASERYLSSILNKSRSTYLPWMLAVQTSLNHIEKHDPDLQKLTLLERQFCIRLMMRWLSSIELRNVLRWVSQFFFKDYVQDSKRKFLYIHGEPHMGKTTFMELMLSSTFFKTKYLSNDFYNANRKGDYYLNCAIFDDPSSIGDDRNWHILNSNFWLNLAQGGLANQMFTLNTKYGFISYHKAQICIISNKSASTLIKNPSMHSRLLSVEFNRNNAFPFNIHSSAETHPFVFKRPAGFDEEEQEEKKENYYEAALLAAPNSSSMFSVPRSESNFNDQIRGFTNARLPLHEDIRHLKVLENGTISSEYFTGATLYYFVWMAILELLGYNLRLQTPQATDYILGGSTQLKNGLFENIPAFGRNYAEKEEEEEEEEEMQTPIEKLAKIPSQFVKNFLGLKSELLLALKSYSQHADQPLAFSHLN